MTSTTLPIHPVTGLRALGMSKRGPIWPVIGGNGEGDGNTADAPVDGADSTDAEGTDATDAQDEGAVEGDGTDAGDSDSAGDGKTFTQADVDRIVKQRLAREKPKGNDKDQEDAAKWRDYENSQKDDVTRLTDELTALKEELSKRDFQALVDEVAKDKGLPPKLAKRLSGKTREELEADADDLMEGLPTPVTPPASSKPTPTNADSKKSSGSDDVFDPKAVAALIPRG